MNSVEFAEWWFESGSGIVPFVGEDAHEHARRVAKAAWQHRQAEIDRLTKNVECLLLAIGICQSHPDPRDLLNESVAMVSKSLEGKS